MGLVPATGDVRLGPAEILRAPTWRRAELGVGFVPEGRGTFAPLSVRENLLLGGYTVDARTRAKRLEEIFGLFPVLQERFDQGASLLSGGEPQMLAVGRALMCSPKALILDEPSMGLAPAITRLLFAT